MNISNIKIGLLLGVILLALNACKKVEEKKLQHDKPVLLSLAIENDKVTEKWIEVLKTRQSKTYLDSLATLVRPLNLQEKEWINLIDSRINNWISIKDSLNTPFENITIPDTTHVLLGYRGYDDGFTYNLNTVCFDITALNNAYGSAKDSVNTNRMDRIFSHEYTHLLHKKWFLKNHYEAESFSDSILQECLYEGIGMYRSMSKKWWPVNGNLSVVAKATFKKLYPVFVEKIIAADSLKNLTHEQKENLHNNLSRGSMKQKWGALPVGVWLALEANGDDKNLIDIINKGPEVVWYLAEKYLTGYEKQRVTAYLKSKNNEL